MAREKAFPCGLFFSCYFSLRVPARNFTGAVSCRTDSWNVSGGAGAGSSLPPSMPVFIYGHSTSCLSGRPPLPEPSGGPCTGASAICRLSSFPTPSGALLYSPLFHCPEIPRIFSLVLKIHILQIIILKRISLIKRFCKKSRKCHAGLDPASRTY